MEDNELLKAPVTLPAGAREDLLHWITAYGLASVLEATRDICLAISDGYKESKIQEGRAAKKQWRSAALGRCGLEDCLAATLDHGPGSGCN